MATQSQVQAFLEKYNKHLSKCFVFVHRKKNMDDLSCLGFTIDNAKETLYNLTPEHYARGPFDDKDYPGQHLWEFGVEVDGIEIYIKVSDNFIGDCAKCISFHKAEFPLTYPLKKE